MRLGTVNLSGALWTVAIALGGVLARAGNEGEERLKERLTPSERIVVAPIVDEAAVGAVRLPDRVVLPKVLVAVGPRAMPAGLAAAGPAVAAPERPAVLAANAPAPGRPQFADGPRQPATPSAALAPRIPNLVQSQRRAIAASSNPVGAPATAVSSPPVNNASGTAVLAPLAPFTREIQVEVAPLPTVLPFDEAPYVQVKGAPDDGDAPGVIEGAGMRARLQ